MRFKIEEDGIHMFLSDREQQKYGLLEDNIINDDDIPFKMNDGDYTIEYNGRLLEFKAKLRETSTAYIVELNFGGYKFNVEKITEINKYDCYRAITREYLNIPRS